MSTFRGTADRQDRAKALTGVVLVHAGLAAVVISGLDVHTVSRAVERLQTFDISEELPPPPEPSPPPKPEKTSAPKDEAAPPNVKSKPTPVIVPKPQIPLPIQPPVNTSTVKGPEGLDRTARASNRPGSGTGAGGQGNGFGGGGRGGDGSGDGFTPAQRVSKIPDGAYRRLVALSGMRTGRIGLTLKVNTDGRPSDCRIARPSGHPQVDVLMCNLALEHVRFRPARDPQGRPVAQDITWFPDWSPR